MENDTKSSSTPIYMMSLRTLLLARRCTLLERRLNGVFEDGGRTGYIAVISLNSKRTYLKMGSQPET
jgi:hypothetical protein